MRCHRWPPMYIAIATLALGCDIGDGGSVDGCRGPGRYEAGKEGSYRPCCPGLTEVFYQKAGHSGDGRRICDSPPLRVYACVQGTCGDGICEAGEAPACGCVADCPSAVWEEPLDAGADGGGNDDAGADAGGNGAADAGADAGGSDAADAGADGGTPSDSRDAATDAP